MKFCQKLKLLREERNMNMTEFANLLGTSKQVISRYERGENTPKITTVAHYANVLNVSLAYLMNDNVTDKTVTTPADKTKAPDEFNITEGEKALLDLFRMLPEEAQKMYLEVLRNSLKSQS